MARRKSLEKAVELADFRFRAGPVCLPRGHPPGAVGVARGDQVPRHEPQRPGDPLFESRPARRRQHGFCHLGHLGAHDETLGGQDRGNVLAGPERPGDERRDQRADKDRSAPRRRGPLSSAAVMPHR